MSINCFKAGLYCFSSLDKILRLCGRWLKTFILKQAPSRNAVNFDIGRCKSVLCLVLVLWIVEFNLYNSLFLSTYSNRKKIYCEYFNIAVIFKTFCRRINILQRIMCYYNLTIIITQWKSKKYYIMGTYIHTFWQVLNVYGTIFHVWRFSNMEIQFYDGAFCVYNKNQKISK